MIEQMANAWGWNVFSKPRAYNLGCIVIDHIERTLLAVVFEQQQNPRPGELRGDCAIVRGKGKLILKGIGEPTFSTSMLGVIYTPTSPCQVNPCLLCK